MDKAKKVSGGDTLNKAGLARRVAKLMIITGYLTNWSDEDLRFAKKLSEIQLFYLLLGYSVNELNDLLDELIQLLDHSPINSEMGHDK